MDGHRRMHTRMRIGAQRRPDPLNPEVSALQAYTAQRQAGLSDQGGLRWITVDYGGSRWISVDYGGLRRQRCGVLRRLNDSLLVTRACRTGLGTPAALYTVCGAPNVTHMVLQSVLQRVLTRVLTGALTGYS